MPPLWSGGCRRHPRRSTAASAAAPPPAQPPAPPKPKKPRRKRYWGRILLALLLVVRGRGVGAAATGSTRRCTASPRWPTTPTGPPPAAGTTWLLVGSDSRQDLTPEQQAELATGGDLGTGRTDTILLVHVPGLGSSTPTTMVSIPRDSYVPIPGYGEDKINAAFAVGGAPLLAQTVEQATGIRLDHYAEIGFDGFAVMVDAVGGVTMCPTEPISDPARGHRPARGLSEARRPQRARLRPHPRHPARRPGPDDQPARSSCRR